MTKNATRALLLLAAAMLPLLAPAGARAQAILQQGARAPDFTSKDLAGRDVHLADFKGKVVVLDFWATWCGPCLKSLPHVQQVAAAHQTDVAVLAVCTGDSRARFEKWIKDNPDQYPAITFTCDPNDRGSDAFDERASNKLYHVTGLPTKFVIGRDGVVAMTIVGNEDDDLRLEAGLARAGVTVDAAVAKRGEEQARRIAEEEARKAAEAAAHPPPLFFPQMGAQRAGSPVPDFTMISADGKEVAFSSLRGKPVVVVWAWSEIVPKKQLQEIARKYGGYGVQTLALMEFTSRPDFDSWVKANPEPGFLAAVDPAGKYEPAGDKPDPKAQMEHMRRTIVGRLMGGNMYPAMPVMFVVDGEGHFGGMVRGGPKAMDAIGNLLLHAGVKLKAEDLPAETAPAEAFAPKAEPVREAEAKVDPIALGAVAPDFETKDAGGDLVRLANHRGKIVVLDFWATWCGPCKASLPHTQEVAAKYRDQGVVVIASCTSDSRTAFEQWLQKNQGDYPDIVFAHDAAEKGPERASRRLYGVAGIPMQFVIGTDGRIAGIVSGYVAGEVLLEGALAKAGVKVDPAILAKAAEDQKQRDAKKPESAVPALPLRGK